MALRSYSGIDLLSWSNRDHQVLGVMCEIMYISISRTLFNRQEACSSAPPSATDATVSAASVLALLY